MKKLTSLVIAFALFVTLGESAARADGKLIFTVTNDYIKDRTDLFYLNTEKGDAAMTTLTHAVKLGEKTESEDVFTLEDVQADNGVLLMRMGSSGPLGRDVVRLKADADFSLTDGGMGELRILRRYGVLFRDDDVRVLKLRIGYSKEDGWAVYYEGGEKPARVTSMFMAKNVISGDTVGIKKVTLAAEDEEVVEILTQKMPGLKTHRRLLSAPESSTPIDSIIWE